MTCKKCRYNNPENNNYCENCGQEIEKNNDNNLSLPDLKNTNNISPSPLKILLFFPITFIYFFLIAIIIYFGCGEEAQQVSWIFALIVDPPLSIVLGIMTTIGIMKKDKKTNQNNNEINTETENNKVNIQIGNIKNNDIKEQIQNKPKKEMNPGLKVLIVAILSPIFAFIIFYLVGGLASMIQNIFNIDFFAFFIEENITAFMGICIILGIIFALATVTDIPEEKSENNNKTNQNKN